MDLEPTRIGGKYEILRELGSGGFATVYLAREVATEMGAERLVAIKVLRDDGTLSDARQRFSQEIRVMANLRHPHIVPLFDTGVWDGRPYLVMPYIEGESLAARIKREGKLPVDDVVKMGIQICEALDYAHKQHLVHRDVKPSNILFDATGNAWLADFGVARWTELTGDDRQTRSSAGVPGTLAYASPEQIAGDRSVAASSDVFSLGVVMFEALTGALPFSGDAREAMVSRMRGDVVPVALAGSDRLLDLVRLCLAPEPAGRPRVPELEGALRAHSPPGASGQIARARSATRTSTFGLLAGAVALVAVVTWSLWEPPRSQSAVSPRFRRVVVVAEDVTGDSVAAAADIRLSQALRRFTDLEVVDPREIRVARSSGEPAVKQIRVQARRIGADHLAYVRVSRGGAGRLVTASLIDVESAIPRAEATVQIAEGVDATEAFDELAAKVALSRGSEVYGVASRETIRVAARDAFIEGREALRGWALDSAIASFASAVAFDPGYARARVWKAAAHMLRGDDLRDVVRPPQEGAASRLLVPGESDLAEALRALGSGAYADARERFLALTDRAGDNQFSWFGLGEGYRLDHEVRRDPASPSGWNFSSSMHAAVIAYARAFASIPPEGATQASHRLRDLLYMSAQQVRGGVAGAADGALLAAMPSWDLRGDSLAFVPYPVEELQRRVPKTVSVALARQRATYRHLAEGWVAAAPNHVGPLIALSAAQELEGDTAAIRTSERALAAANTSEVRVWAAQRHVAALVRFGFAGDSARLIRAASLADSVLRAEPGTERTAAALASMAALSGHVEAALRLVGLAAQPINVPVPNGIAEIPAPIVAELERVTLLSALGADSGAILQAAARFREGVSRIVPQIALPHVTGVLLSLPAQLAFATSRVRLLDRTEVRDNDLVRGQLALSGGDTTLARALLAELRGVRQALPPAEVGIDAALPESDLLASLGDTVAAAEWVGRAIDALPFAPLVALEGYVQVAALIAGSLKRAGWASQRAVNVRLLWARADARGRDLLARM